MPKFKTDFGSEIGARLQLRRECLGLSRPELGRMIAVTRHRVFSYETGQDRISAGWLYVFSRVLSAPPEYFFGECDAGPAIVGQCHGPDVATKMDARASSRLRLRRMELGLYLSALAERLGLSIGSIRQYETGKCRISAGALHELAEMLLVPLSYFYDDMTNERGQGEREGGADACAPSQR